MENSKILKLIIPKDKESTIGETKSYLTNMLSPFGTVTSLKLSSQRRNNFQALVKFDCASSTDAAQDGLRGKSLLGQLLHVETIE